MFDLKYLDWGHQRLAKEEAREMMMKESIQDGGQFSFQAKTGLSQFIKVYTTVHGSHPLQKAQQQQKSFNY